MAHGDVYARLGANDDRDGILESSQPCRGMRSSVVKTCFAGVGLIGIGVAIASFRTIKRSHDDGVQVADATSEAMGFTSLTESNSSCWSNTGGTCYVLWCYSNRGPTDCVDHQCFCKPGFCTALDGKCYPVGNTLVANNFTLRSARWSDHRLYADGCEPKSSGGTDRLSGYLRISKEDQGLKSRWSLWQLPTSPAKKGEPTYILRSLAFPECVATLDQVTTCHLSYEEGEQEKVCRPETLGVVEVPWGSVANAAVLVKRFHHTSQISFESTHWKDWFLHVPPESESVKPWPSEPKMDGRWIADPPLPWME
eukprot:TRINITY_DN22702_c0_g1_i1.p1 TRINITY_DN22702_c0_g1~~TRINITY_DN22702_c0_g1_i1.p1  ORF type:complete len:310 (-),score=22.30 TRINITY_DN22702_c0_g1_i1:178-1107(-)